MKFLKNYEEVNLWHCCTIDIRELQVFTIYDVFELATAGIHQSMTVFDFRVECTSKYIALALSKAHTVEDNVVCQTANPAQVATGEILLGAHCWTTASCLDFGI